MERLEELRPRLHRHCSRMTGSALDGEDLVQETLAQAYFRLHTVRRGVAFDSWVFRIAHNRCVDFLRRRRRARNALQQIQVCEASAPPEGEQRAAVPGALTHPVTALPPMERAAILLKDVLGYSLAETATIVETSVGGVKSALYRGRRKLERCVPGTDAPADERTMRFLEEYVARFNARDWSGVSDLIRADARLEVPGKVEAYGREAIQDTYFPGYEVAQVPWYLVAGRVDGEAVVVVWRHQADGWVARSAVRLTHDRDGILAIRDYAACPAVLEGCLLDAPAPEIQASVGA